VKPQNYSNN